MLDAAHDPFVTREDSPLGATRRALFDLLAQLERLRPTAPMCVDVLAGEVVCGTLEVASAGLTLRGAHSDGGTRDQLVHALHEWVTTHAQPLNLVPSTTPPRGESRVGAGVAELFACAGSLSEPPRQSDGASRAFAEHAARGSMCILLRLRERSELLPYPVAGQTLDGMGLRTLVKLCHAAASLVRPPGWQSNVRPSLTWGVLRVRERTYAIVPGETHVALLHAREEDLDELFRRTNARAMAPAEVEASDGP